MDTRPCSFCSHENPEDAKFCNACGSSTHLQLCPHCGAIDNLSAVACYKCGASFSSHASGEEVGPDVATLASATEHGTPGGATVPASTRNAAPSARASAADAIRRAEKPRGAAARALLFVMIAAAAVFLYRAYSPSEESGAGAPQALGPDRTSPGAIDATLGAVPPSSATLAAEVVPVGTQPQVPAVSQPPTPDDLPLSVAPAPPEVPEASTAAGADGSEAPPGSYRCTPEVAALGLCN